MFTDGVREGQCRVKFWIRIWIRVRSDSDSRVVVY